MNQRIDAEPDTKSRSRQVAKKPKNIRNDAETKGNPQLDRGASLNTGLNVWH